MTLELIIQNWALAVASVLGFAILLFVLSRLYEQSAQGRLGAEAGELQKLQRDLARAEQTLVAAEQRLKSLRGKADSVKPRALSEAEEAVQDASAMQKIIEDQILRTKKRVGDVILEEFSPNRQDVLRTKYL
ncbi:MAG: hypothetical protein ACR2QL_03815 [Woeseiaceae bacterium]